MDSNEKAEKSVLLQYDKDFRYEISLKHSSVDITQEPVFLVRPPSSVRIKQDLLESCIKKEPREAIKRKILETILAFMRPQFVAAYSGGSSNSDYDRSGTSIFFTYSDSKKFKIKVSAENIGFKFPCENFLLLKKL